jgi:hypothetical protein
MPTDADDDYLIDDDDDLEVLTRAETRAALKIGKTTFDAMVARGELPKPDVSFGPRLQRYTKPLVRSMVRAHLVKGGS